MPSSDTHDRLSQDTLSTDEQQFLQRLSSPVWARPPGGRPPHRGVPLEHLIEELGLDDETLAQADAVIDASRTEERSLREADRFMRTLLEQEEPDEDAVMTQVESIGGLRTNLRKEQLRTMLRVRALLTPEQRIRLLQRLKDRPRRGPGGRGGRRGRHGGPPPGNFGGPGDDSSRQPPPAERPF